MCSILRMERLFHLTDDQWQRLLPLLPPETTTAKGGRRPLPHRPMVEAILWVLRTGAPWRDLPSAYGCWGGIYKRFWRWSRAGVWERIFNTLNQERDEEKAILDATHVRVHQDGGGGVARGLPSHRKEPRRADHQDPCCC